MLPPVVTHNMVDGEKDEILQHVRRTGLLNQSDQRTTLLHGLHSFVIVVIV